MSELLHFSEHTLQEVALIFMALVYTTRIIWLLRYKAGGDRQAPTGLPGTTPAKGILYSWANVAMPWAMESTRRQFFLYVQFVIFHLGVTAAILLSFIIPYFPDLLKNGTVCNAVNAPCVAKELLTNIKPYISLAEKMGSILCQISDGRMSEFWIHYSGDVLNYDIAPITMAAIKGLLSPILREEVNDVNAMVTAKERGIKVEEAKESMTSAFLSLISLKLKTDQGMTSVSGTLYNRTDPRIVELNGFDVEIIPSDNMLIFSNIDKPGLIGNIGTTLGQMDINIAGMQFGREKPGGKAVSILRVDTPVSDELLEKLKKLPNVVSVKSVKL